MALGKFKKRFKKVSLLLVFRLTSQSLCCTKANTGRDSGGYSQPTHSLATADDFQTWAAHTHGAFDLQAATTTTTYHHPLTISSPATTSERP